MSVSVLGDDTPHSGMDNARNTTRACLSSNEAIGLQGPVKPATACPHGPARPAAVVGHVRVCAHELRSHGALGWEVVRGSPRLRLTGRGGGAVRVGGAGGGLCGLGHRGPQVMSRSLSLSNHMNRAMDCRELHRQTPVYHQV